MVDDNNSFRQTAKVKYKPSKIGRVALGIAISLLSIGLVISILSVLSIVPGYIILITVIVAHIVSMIAFTFLMVDKMRFNKINHVKEDSDNKMAVGLVVGIIIGFIWGKML